MIYLICAIAVFLVAAAPVILWKAKRNTALIEFNSEEAKAARSHTAALEFLGRNGVLKTEGGDVPLQQFLAVRAKAGEAVK